MPNFTAFILWYFFASSLTLFTPLFLFLYSFFHLLFSWTGFIVHLSFFLSWILFTSSIVFPSVYLLYSSLKFSFGPFSLCHIFRFFFLHFVFFISFYWNFFIRYRTFFQSHLFIQFLFLLFSFSFALFSFHFPIASLLVLPVFRVFLLFYFFYLSSCKSLCLYFLQDMPLSTTHGTLFL